MDKTTNITVVGAGAWGTAFAIHLARKGFNVLMWVYEEELYDLLSSRRNNEYYLPGFVLPDKIGFTNNLNDIEEFSKNIVLATPSFALRNTIKHIAGYNLAGRNFLLLTKGLEIGTLLRMSQVAEEELSYNDSNVAVLSGPSFAEEVARGAFTSVVVSSNNKALSLNFQKLIHNDDFRVYTSEDLTGVELGGAMKNVMAIGAGIIEGLQLGTNTQAAFITRAIAEIKRLGRALGAKDTTFMGLSGIGDLMLTSYGKLSRNRWFGTELAKGRKPETIIKEQKKVVEGYYTINAAYTFSKRFDIEMPITDELYKIVYEGKELRTSLNDIKKRALKEEDN